MMDRLTGLRLFREIVETGSFSAAAERMGLSAPMASKHIARLENATGARLLNRSSRHLSPTEAGQTYYAQCRQALDILDAADAAIHQGAASPRGQLKITAPVWCANARFASALAGYRARYPDVIVDMRLENRTVDLVAEGFDLALRATLEPSPTLFARLLCTVRFRPVATPDYLARERKLDDRRSPVLDFIAPSYLAADKLALMRGSGASTGSARTVMRSDDTTLTYFSVLAGIGIAFLPEWIIADDLASGRLVDLHVEPEMPAMPLYAVYASRSHIPPKLRTFIDFLVGRLGEADMRPDPLPRESRRRDESLRG
jgi:DNA-binding transcriptional LysR family regulator